MCWCGKGPHSLLVESLVVLCHAAQQLGYDVRGPLYQSTHCLVTVQLIQSQRNQLCADIHNIHM